METLAGFEKVPGEFGVFRWDHEPRSVKVGRRDALGLVRALARSMTDEAGYLAFTAVGRAASSMGSGARPFLDRVAQQLASEMEQRDGFLKRTYCLLSVAPDQDESPVSYDVIATLHVDVIRGEATWRFLSKRPTRKTMRYSREMSWSWMGKPMYDYLGAGKAAPAREPMAAS